MTAAPRSKLGLSVVRYGILLVQSLSCMISCDGIRFRHSARQFRVSIVVLFTWMIGGNATCSGLTCEYLSEPLNERPDSYRTLLRKELLTSSGEYGVMIMMTTGLSEWAVSVGPKSETVDKQRTYQLSYTSASRSFYELLSDWNHTKAKAHVSKIDVEIDKAFALAVQKGWRRILSKDPHPLKEWEKSFTVDGYTADFSVRTTDGTVITRRTLNAQLPPAIDIVRLGYALRDYCLSPIQERQRRRREIIHRLTEFCDLLNRCDKAE